MITGHEDCPRRYTSSDVLAGAVRSIATGAIEGPQRLRDAIGDGLECLIRRHKGYSSGEVIEEVLSRVIAEIRARLICEYCMASRTHAILLSYLPALRPLAEYNPGTETMGAGRAVIASLIAPLSARERKALTLAYVEGSAIARVTQETGMSEDELRALKGGLRDEYKRRTQGR